MSQRNLEVLDEEEEYLNYFKAKEMNPIEKYKRKNQFPKRMLISVLLIIFTTIQVKIYETYYKDYRRFNIDLWENLLLEIDDDEVLIQKYYTVGELYNNLHHIIEFFNEIDDQVLFKIEDYYTTEFSIFSFYDKSPDKQDTLQSYINIEQGIKDPFDYDNLDQVKLYSIQVQRFAIQIHNLHTRFPFLGTICWNIQVHYQIKSDFVIEANLDATQVRCSWNEGFKPPLIEDEDEIVVQNSQNEKLSQPEQFVRFLEQYTDVNHPEIQKSLQNHLKNPNKLKPIKRKMQKKTLKTKRTSTTKKNNKKSKFSKIDSPKISEVNKFGNFDKYNTNQQYQEKYQNEKYQDFNTLSKSEQMYRMSVYKNYKNMSAKEKIKANKQFKNYQVEGGFTGIGSSGYGYAEALVINIIVIILSSISFGMNMNHMYRGIKYYIGLKHIRRKKVLKALKKIQSLTNFKMFSKKKVKGKDEGEEIEMEKIKKPQKANKLQRQVTMHQNKKQEQQKIQQSEVKPVQKIEYLGYIDIEAQNRSYDYLKFWHVFTMIGNFIQIMCSLSLAVDQFEEQTSSDVVQTDNFFRDTLIGFGCAFAWVGVSEFLETMHDRKHDVFSYLMKNLLKSWTYNLITVLPVFMFYVIIGTSFYWKSHFFSDMTMSAISLFSIYHGDMVSDFMYSINDVTENPLHLIYITSYTMVFAMFVYNMFTSVIMETRTQLIQNRENQIKKEKEKKKALKQQKKIEERKASQGDMEQSELFFVEEQSSLSQKQQQFDIYEGGVEKARQESIDLESEQLKKKKQEAQFQSLIRSDKLNEDEIFEDLEEQLEINKITIESLLKEFEQIQNLFNPLNIEQEEQIEIQNNIIQFLQSLNKKIEKQMKESQETIMFQKKNIQGDDIQI